VASRNTLQVNSFQEKGFEPAGCRKKKCPLQREATAVKKKKSRKRRTENYFGQSEEKEGDIKQKTGGRIEYFVREQRRERKEDRPTEEDTQREREKCAKSLTKGESSNEKEFSTGEKRGEHEDNTTEERCRKVSYKSLGRRTKAQRVCEIGQNFKSATEYLKQEREKRPPLSPGRLREYVPGKGRKKLRGGNGLRGKQQGCNRIDSSFQGELEEWGRQTV